MAYKRSKAKETESVSIRFEEVFLNQSHEIKLYDINKWEGSTEITFSLIKLF